MIPSTFTLFGETWTVKIDKDLVLGDNACGVTYYDRLLIVIDDNIPDDRKIQTFYHEITHVILKGIGQDKLNNDEPLVDLIGSCLHQILHSVAYKNEFMADIGLLPKSK